MKASWSSDLHCLIKVAFLNEVTNNKLKAPYYENEKKIHFTDDLLQ